MNIIDISIFWFICIFIHYHISGTYILYMDRNPWPYVPHKGDFSQCAAWRLIQARVNDLLSPCTLYHIKYLLFISFFWCGGGRGGGVGDILNVSVWFSYPYHKKCPSFIGKGPLARYVKLRVAHAPGMQRAFCPLPRVSDPDMHHGTCVTHVPWCMPGSLTGGFLWRWCRGKRSRHSQRMRNPQFYVSGKRPMVHSHDCSTWLPRCQ